METKPQQFNEHELWARMEAGQEIGGEVLAQVISIEPLAGEEDAPDSQQIAA